MMLSKSSIVKISKNVVHCEVEDEVIILGMKDGIYYGLDHVGVFIWNIIQSPINVNEIHIAILENFDVTKEESETDLLELLSELVDNNLIEVLDDER